MPSNTFSISKKISKAALVAATGVTVALPFFLVPAYHRSCPPIAKQPPAPQLVALVEKPAAETNDNSLHGFAPPAYLNCIVPPLVHGLAVEDVDGQNGRYKLVVWSRWLGDTAPGDGLSSQIMLVRITESGRGALVWQSSTEELYEPRIIVEPDWKHKGNQVFLIVRQAGAAATFCRPVWIGERTVHMLPELYAEHFAITNIKQSQKHEMVCYVRSGPKCEDSPFVHRWNGNRFTE